MRTKAITLLLLVVIILGACTPEVRLPRLYEASVFTLTNQDSQEVKLIDFRGKVVLMDFIYTNCPDICGTLNYKLQDIWQQLDTKLSKDLVLISVSFDPEIDTPEVLKRYAAFYDVPGWQFLTGTPEQIRQVTDEYGVAYVLDEAGHEGGSQHSRTFKHSIVIVIIDRDGMVRKTYGATDFPAKDMVRELESLLVREEGSL